MMDISKQPTHRAPDQQMLSGSISDAGRYNNMQILYDVVLKTMYQVFKYYHIKNKNATPGFTYIFGKRAVDSYINDSKGTGGGRIRGIL